MKADKHIEILGKKGKDRVTGFEGVITSVSFDLFGCVQAVLTPPATEGKTNTGHWFDVPRIEITDNNKVMPVPDFEKGYVAEGKKGPADKPLT